MVSILKLLSELAQLLRLLLRQFSDTKKARKQRNAKGFETLAKAVVARRRVRRDLPDADRLPNSPYRRD